MSETSGGLPLMAQTQNSRYLTFNESMWALNVLQTGVLDRDLDTPPGSPTEGDAYIVASGGTGAWAGHDDDIAFFFDGIWNFLEPILAQGRGIWVDDEGALIRWSIGSPGGWTLVGAGDASSISYTPSVPADWDGSADPGETNDALDQLAERVKDLEGGTGGTELKGLTFTSDTGSTADSDPGNGLFKWNNATQSSATVLYFDNQTLDAISLTTFYTAIPPTGYIFLQQSDDATKWQLWKWSAVVDGTGYRKFTVAHQASGGSIADDKTVLVDFKPNSGETTTTAGALIDSASSKATPIDADHVGLMDSAASNILKKLSWANLKATLKTYFDTLYGSSTGISPGDLYAAIAALSPMAWWKCNETSGTTLADSSGNGYTLTLSGSAGTQYTLAHSRQVPSNSDKYLFLMTTASKASRTGTLGFSAPITGDWTVIGFITPFGVNSAANDVSVLAIGASGETQVTNTQLRLYCVDTILNTLWEHSTGTNDVTASIAASSVSQNNFVAAVKDGTANTVQFYLHGVKWGAAVAYSNEPDGGTDPTMETSIGANADGLGTSQCIISNVAVWNSKLTDAQIHNLAVQAGLVN